MLELADGLLTPCTRQNDGIPETDTVSEIFSEPAGTAVDSTTVASPNVRPLSVAHDTPELPAALGRSGVCAETMAAARNAAPATYAAHLSIMGGLRSRSKV